MPKTKPKKATIPAKTLKERADERAAIMGLPIPTAEKLRRLRELSR